MIKDFMNSIKFQFIKKENREVYLEGEINDELAKKVVAMILYLVEKNKKEDIKLIINSPGGSITAAFAIYDVIQFVKCNVSTVIKGEAHGIALLIAISGTKGKRFIFNESMVGLVPFSHTKDLDQMQNVNYRQAINKMKNHIYSIFSLNTNQEMNKIIMDIEGETILSAKEALNYGLVDKVIKK